MSEIVYKVLDCEVKKVQERTYEFTASTEKQDRDGEVIEAAGWDLKNYEKNPVIMYAHDYRTLPIGKATRVWISRGKLKNTVQFPPEGTYEFADIVERLVDTGYLKTESVGFIPKKWEDGDGEKAPKRVYTKQELLEISIVPVPSNPDALRNAMDDGVITTKEFDTITKPETENPQKKEISQASIMDELDYLIRLIDTEGMNDEAIDDAWNLVREVMRLTGGDIPDDILEKVGAVLNQKNKDRLGQIKVLAQQVLDSAGQVEPEDEKDSDPGMSMDYVIDIVKATVTDVIEKAQGKVS